MQVVQCYNRDCLSLCATKMERNDYDRDTTK